MLVLVLMLVVLVLVVLVLVVLVVVLFQRTLAHQQVLVRLPVLGAHHHVDDRVDARGQVDEHVRGDVEHVHAAQLVRRFADGDGKVARDERREYHQDHL